MKPLSVLCFLLLFMASGFSVWSQEKWISDNEMQFKIKIPQNYSQTEMRDGSDKVFTIMSPDQNVFVRVRAMQANNKFSSDILQQVFEQNIIQGAQRIMNEDGDLNGIPVRTSAYSWNVEGNDVILSVYYIVQNNYAYVVWAAVPKNQEQQYSVIADEIIDSFNLLPPSSNAFAGLSSNSDASGQVTLVEFQLGKQVDNNYRVQSNVQTFTTYTNKIHLGFSYSGNTYATPFALKWFSHTHNQLVQEYSLNSPNENGGHGHGFISNNGNPWPKGKYYVEIWHDGKMLSSNDFEIQ